VAIIGNNADTLLRGLSDFWLRFFQDVGDLQAAYEGAEILMGQAYLDLLSAVLNQSVIETPLFNKKYYTQITVREDQLTWREGAGSDVSGWLLKTGRYGKLPSLQNKVFSPTAALEAELDYQILDDQLLFLIDPTNPPIQGYAQRPVDILCGGFFKADSVVDWTALDVKKGDTLEVTAPGRTARQFTITLVKPDYLALSTETPSPSVPTGATETVYSWNIQRDDSAGNPVGSLPADTTLTGHFSPAGPVQVYELSLWAVDAAVDEHELHRVYGHLFGASQNSSEAYRAFIRGLMQLYALGPAIDRIESAMNVAAGLSVVRDDGEVLMNYSNDTDAQRVTTDKRVYVYPIGLPMRTDVIDPANFGVLTFRVFEPLTTAVQVVDHLKDPFWWHGIIIPEELMPGRDTTDRTATPQLFELKYGTTYRARYGDVGLRYGATEDGLVRSNVHRHCAAFILTDRYLKHHMFAVKVDSTLTALGSSLISDLQSILREMKPSYTAIYLTT
jgi:hypothetical protein